MSFNINLGGWKSIFAVPSQVVDNDLKTASAYQLKVLLYILRHCDEQLSNEDIGQALSMHPSDVKDSLTHWIDRGLITKQDDQIIPAQKNNYKKQEIVNEKPVQQNLKSIEKEITTQEKEQKNKDEYSKKEKTKPRGLSRAQRPDSLFVAQRLKQDENLVALMDEAQVVLGKPLSSGDTATLVMLHDTDGLPVDVLIMLMQYCVSIEKGNMRTIERIGLQWSSEGISSLEAAEEKIKTVKQNNSAWAKVSGIFGIKNIGSPTKKQLEFAHRWLIEWKFSSEMLREAYELCVDARGDVQLPYINGILKRWYADEIKNLDKLRESKLTRKSGKKTTAVKEKNKPSYDLDEYLKTSIFDD